MENYVRYWGKADQTTKQWHPLVCHMLDVAAVARVMMQSMPDFLGDWSARLDISPKHLLDLICFYSFLHDIGKFSSEFQCKIPALAELLQESLKPSLSGNPHTALAWLLWDECLETQLYARYNIQFNQAIDLCNTLEPLFSASFGHHGSPVMEPNAISKRTFGRIFSDSTIADATALLSEILVVFDGIQTILLKPEKLISHRKDIASFSFILSGLIILADWTASATSNIPYLVHAGNGGFSDEFEFDDLAGYFSWSCVLAKGAVERQGLVPVLKKRLRNPWKELFPNLYEAQYDPSPLQEMMIHLEPADEPGLYVIEDLAGSGKTEAALVLYSKLQMKSSADGLYFALPTMATSNGMYARLKETHKRFFVDGTGPSFILAHGGSRFHKDFQDSIIFDVHTIPKDTYDDSQLHAQTQEIDHQTSQSSCSEWIADRSRKVFLAQVGVGSIDQALLSVLYAKHNTLRMFGLARKILIIDEVHAYDLYMQRILHTLLEFMASQHRSVILLSATLPLAMKADLANAYRKGLHHGVTTEMEESDADSSFPMVTIYQKGQSIHIPVQARTFCRRTVKLEFFSSIGIEGPLKFLKEVSESGRCGVWIRNTVFDVQTAYAKLVEAIGSANVLVFHSRYSMEDRQRIESNVLEIFGKESSEDQRKGKILIASQVVEQSLDLDFDEMITDLCPIDLIIQRAGRLKRHTRDSSGNPISGDKDKRGIPLLHIYGPCIEGIISKNWYSEFFLGGSCVYRDAGILWRTAKLLFEEKELAVPEKSRYMIERVYGKNAERIPDSLKEISGIAAKKNHHDEAVAESNVFPLFDGFAKPSNTSPWPDHLAPTRLTDDVVAYRLCLYVNEKLIPMTKDKDFAWQMCEVKFRKTTIEYEHVFETLIRETEKGLPDFGRGGVLLPMELDSKSNTENMSYHSIGHTCDGMSFSYDSIRGLSLRSTG